MTIALHSTDAPDVGSPVDVLSEKDVDNLIYIISHDVRNSVRALIEIPQWIDEDLARAGVSPDPELRTNLDMMTTHARRLDRMMHDLLVFSRVGRLQNVEEVSIASVIENVLSQIALQRTARVETRLEVASVRIGERDILTLISTLITNAVRHHHGPSATIRIATEMEGHDVLLTVEDDGPGIAPEFRERVFNPMQTLRPRDEVEGSGMGLAIARKIARTYGGSIAIDDPESGHGTRVRFRLPSRKTLN